MTMAKKKKKIVKFSIRTRAIQEAQEDLQRICRDIAPFVKPRKERVYMTEGRWSISSNLLDCG